MVALTLGCSLQITWESFETPNVQVPPQNSLALGPKTLVVFEASQVIPMYR